MPCAERCSDDSEPGRVITPIPNTSDTTATCGNDLTAETGIAEKPSKRLGGKPEPARRTLQPRGVCGACRQNTVEGRGRQCWPQTHTSVYCSGL